MYRNNDEELNIFSLKIEIVPFLKQSIMYQFQERIIYSFKVFSFRLNERRDVCFYEARVLMSVFPETLLIDFNIANRLNIKRYRNEFALNA